MERGQFFLFIITLQYEYIIVCTTVPTNLKLQYTCTLEIRKVKHQLYFDINTY